MSKELQGSVRCRNYAEALRMVVAGKQIDDSIALLCVADTYEKLADLLEAIHRSGTSDATPACSE